MAGTAERPGPLYGPSGTARPISGQTSDPKRESGMRIDLAQDYTVKLSCGCAVTFVGRSGHRKTCSVPRCMKASCAEHIRACVRAAKRYRATQMEKIDPNETDLLE